MFSLFEAFCNLIYFALHITGTGSFPRPLSAKEERECLEGIARGDEEAKTRLIEHNLRLVAHIIKKYYSAFKDQDDLIHIQTRKRHAFCNLCIQMYRKRSSHAFPQ